MKIAVACESLSLQKALELFLAHHVVPLKKCDIVIVDTMPKNKNIRYFFIGNEENAHLHKPFSKAQLILALQKHYKRYIAPRKEQRNTQPSLTILEQKIEALTKEYQNNLLHIIREHYETDKKATN